MAEKPENSGIPPPQPPISQPTSTRTIRRRRPTAIPSDDTPRNEVRILRPSEVPQREPLPEYKEPVVDRRIVPNNIPLERLNEYQYEITRNVVIPMFMTADELIIEAERAEGLVSFRSTNHVDPDIIWNEILEKQKRQLEGIDIVGFDGNEIDDQLGKALQHEFIERNRHFFGKTVMGCTARIEEKDPSYLYITVEAPKDSIYTGGFFFLTIHLPIRNGMVAPSVQFVTLIFHPNLSKYGNFDIRELMRDWNRTTTLDVLYRYLRRQMTDLKSIIQRKTLAQLEDMSQPNIALLAYQDWNKFEDIARKLTAKMAGGSLDESGTVRSGSDMTDKWTPETGWARPNLKEDEIDVVGDW